MDKLIKRSWLNLAVIPALGVCLIGIVFISEWINIGIIADPETVGRYYFGGEAMMAHGGWFYASASLYAWKSFVEGTLLLCVGLFSALASLQAKGRKVSIGMGVFLVWLIITQISMHAS